jgi:hypothetical protein
LKSLFLWYQTKQVMGSAQIREALHEYINHADDSVLNLFYGMMNADNDELLTKEQQEDLDNRVARHKSGESKSYSLRSE